MAPPKVFVSYAWHPREHKAWVKELGVRLRMDGVEVILDVLTLVHGDDLAIFMERGISTSDYVLIVCSPEYKAKSESRKGGVGYEGAIIAGEKLIGEVKGKYIPILRSGDWKDATPVWLVSTLGADFRTEPEEEYKELLQTLLGARFTGVKSPPFRSQSELLDERPAPKAPTSVSKSLVISPEATDQELNWPAKLVGQLALGNVDPSVLNAAREWLRRTSDESEYWPWVLGALLNSSRNDLELKKLAAAWLQKTEREAPGWIPLWSTLMNATPESPDLERMASDWLVRSPIRSSWFDRLGILGRLLVTITFLAGLGAAGLGWNGYVDHREEMERQAKFEAQLREDREKERTKAIAVAARGAEWDKKVRDGMAAIVDAAIGKGDAKAAVNKFPLDTKCGRGEGGSLICEWADFTSSLGMYDGSGRNTSRPQGDFEKIELSLKRYLTERGAKSILGWSKAEGVDSKGMKPIARRRYELDLDGRKTVLDMDLQSFNTPFYFLSRLELIAYPSGSEPPFLKEFEGSSVIQEVPFNSIDGLFEYLGKAVGETCTKRDKIDCKLMVGDTEFLLYHEPVKDGVLTINFLLSAHDSDKPREYNFEPAVQRLIQPMLAKLGLPQPDYEKCTTFTPDDTSQKLFVDAQRHFQLGCSTTKKSPKNFVMEYVMKSDMEM